MVMIVRYSASRKYCISATNLVFVVVWEKCGTRQILKSRILSQVETLQVLQRLFDELVELQDSCRLDRYAGSGKASR